MISNILRIRYIQYLIRGGNMAKEKNTGRNAGRSNYGGYGNAGYGNNGYMNNGYKL